MRYMKFDSSKHKENYNKRSFIAHETETVFMETDQSGIPKRVCHSEKDLEKNDGFTMIRASDKSKEESLNFVVDRGGHNPVSKVSSDGHRPHHPPLYISNPYLAKLSSKHKSREEPLTKSSGVRATTKPYSRNGWNQNFVSSNAASKTSTAKLQRYHVDDEHRFSSLKPGVISEALRDALGIRSNQLPLYIYRMRCLGYPPGHLQKACLQRSNILVYTKNRQELTSSGDVLEEGELNEEPEAVAYDVNQLIDFPGFNIDPPNGTLDECQKLDMPLMSPDQSKEVMIQKLLSPSLFEKESRNPENKQFNKMGSGSWIDCKDEANDISTHEDEGQGVSCKTMSEGQMDELLSEMGLRAKDGWRIVDVYSAEEDSQFVSVSPINESSSDEVPVPFTPNKIQSAESQLHVDQLVEDIENDLCEDGQSAENQQREADHSPVLRHSGSCAEAETILEPFSDVTSADSVMVNDQTPKQPVGYGCSLGVSSGTPVAFDAEFCSKHLPDASLFSSGITEYIPYENLPNSTGAFRRLRIVLKEARSKTPHQPNKCNSKT